MTQDEANSGSQNFGSQNFGSQNSGSHPMAPMTAAQAGDKVEHLRSALGRVIQGQDDVLEQVLVALLARGHVLLEGPPGLGKTLLARALAALLGCTTKRIQFTPDLMPSDITGGNVFNQGKGAFEFVPGALFADLLVADEINRAPAKTQSALLEAMQERSVTTDGVTRPLPPTFMVIATQNPLESQGTYPLPEAQLDRFLLKIILSMPDAQTEKHVVKQYLGGFDAATLSGVTLQPVCSPAELRAMQHVTRHVHVDESLISYAVELVSRTRRHRSFAFGASPRGTLALVACAQAKALMAGRDFCVPDDFASLAPAVLRHRVGLLPDAELQGQTADSGVRDVLQSTTVPASPMRSAAAASPASQA